MIGSDRRRTRARQPDEDVKSDKVAENFMPTERVRRRRARPAPTVATDNSSVQIDSESFSKTSKTSEDELEHKLDDDFRKSKDSKEEPFSTSHASHSAQDHSYKDDEVDHAPGKYSGVVKSAYRHGDKLSASSSNLEKSGCDLRVYIPAGRVSSRQSAFEEKVNSGSSPSRPTLTRSNSKPLGADSEKFRRNLEAWGERSEVQQYMSQKCESIADLRAVDLSRQNGSASRSITDAKLSSAKSSVTLNRTANLKADVGGLVTRWESRQTFADEEKLSPVMTQSPGVVSGHSPSIPIVTRPLEEIRQKIQPKSTPATHRTILGKPGFSDVRKQWESQAAVSDQKHSRSRSKSPFAVYQSPSRNCSEISEKVVSGSQRSDGITLTTTNNVANIFEDYSKGQSKRSKSSERDMKSDKTPLTSKCDFDVSTHHGDICNANFDSDISIHSDIGKAKCDSDSGNISVDSDLVNISTDSEVVNNSVENEFVNNKNENLVDKTENESVIDRTRKESVVDKTNSDVTSVGNGGNVVNTSVGIGYVKMSPDVDRFDNKHDCSDTNTTRDNVTENNGCKIASARHIVENEKIGRDKEIHLENRVSAKESVGKKINRKFSYRSYDETEQVNNITEQKKAIVDNVSVVEKMDSQSDRKSRHTIKPVDLEMESSEKESVGQKINRAFGKKFQERYENSALEMWNVDFESDGRSQLRSKTNEVHSGDDVDSEESQGRQINATVNDKLHRGRENKKMESENTVSSREKVNVEGDGEVVNIASTKVEKENVKVKIDVESEKCPTPVVEKRNASANLARNRKEDMIGENQKVIQSSQRADSADFKVDSKFHVVKTGADRKAMEVKRSTENEQANNSPNRTEVKHRFGEELRQENVIQKNSQQTRKGTNSDTVPPVMGQLNKSAHSTEEKRDRILRKLEGIDDVKTSNRKVIQKMGFKDIRNRWEDKSVSEAVPPVSHQSHDREDKGDNSAVFRRPDLENSSVVKSAPPVKPKPRRENSSMNSSEPVTTEHSAPAVSCHDDQLLSDQSERHAETSSSSSDESGCEDHDDVFAQNLGREQSKENKSTDIALPSVNKDADSVPETCTTVRAKVIKIQPSGPARVKADRGKPLSRSNSGTWPARKCVTYTTKVTYTQKVIGHHDNKGQMPQDTRKSSRQPSESSALKTESSVKESVVKHSMETSGKTKLRNQTTMGSDSSNQSGPVAKRGNSSKSMESSVSTDREMKPRLPKSLGVPEVRHSRSDVSSPTSPKPSRSKLVTKGSAPELVKTRQNLRSTKLNSTNGSKQFEQNSSMEKCERHRKDRNVPSVFERLHSNLPARKSLSVRDLREKEHSNMKLRKSPSRSSLRGSFRSSKSKKHSEDGISGKRHSSGSHSDERLNSSEAAVSSAQHKSAEMSTNISCDGNKLNDSSCSMETSVDTSGKTLKNNGDNSANSQCGKTRSDENGCGDVRINHSCEKVTNHCSSPESVGPTVNSEAPDRRARRWLRESLNQGNSLSNHNEPVKSSVKPSENENDRDVRHVKQRVSSKDTELPTTEPKQDGIPVFREYPSRQRMETGGRSRSTNGSIASTSSSTDLPRGSRSTEGGKQNQGYQQKIVNIDFASESSNLPQDGSDQAAKITEPSQATPKVKQIPPEFIIKPRRQLGDEGETAKFKASFDGSPEPELSWEFKGKVLTNGSKYKIYKKDDFHFLEVQSLLMEDAGKYTCLIRNSAGEASMAANLEVFENPKSTKSKSSPPVFETELKDVVAKEGDRNVCLECRVKAAHDCEVKWYCDGELLKSGRDFRLGFDGSWAKLHFYDLKAEFGGCYECVVKNAGGAAKSSATLTVQAALPKSFPPKFTQQLRSQTLDDGQRLIFHAIVTGSPQPSVKWFRNSREITATEDVMISFDGTNAKLQIEDVLPEDSADFTCLAQNEAGEARTKATLTVLAVESAATSEVRKEAPRFLRELKNIEVKDGERVEMVVEVEGTPPIDVVWVRNNKEIPANSPDFVQTSQDKVHKLVIEEVFPEDSGNYACEIYNDYGDTDSQCKLTVQDAGEAQGPPEFVIKPKTVQTEEGSPVTFICQVKGNPVPTVEWEINGKAVVVGRRVRVSQQGEDHRLDIPHSVCGDSGRYTCVVSNSHGTITHTASLNVTPSASIDSQEQTDFRSVLKSRPGLASIGSQDSTESIQSVHSEKSDKGEVEQHDFRKVLTRPVETKRRPKFKTLLLDQKTKEGGEVTLECEVKGVPQPTISWSVGGKPIKESKYFRMRYEDNIAQLLIAEAYPEDEGEYTCTAENVAGSASCSCDLYVEEAASDSDSKQSSSRSSDQVEAPRIIEFEPVNISVKKGKTVKIRSRFSGEPAPKIMWFHNKSSVKTDNRVKIETRRDVSTVTVSDILPSDGGKYILVIENVAGSQDAVASVNVEDVPNPPAGKPHITSVTKTSIILTWYGPAYDGGSQITNYRVEVCKCKDQMWKTLTSTCKNTSYQAINLIPDTEYQFRISAGNKHGLSDAGQVSDPVITTDNFDPKSEPESDDVTQSLLLAYDEKDELPFEPRNVKVRTDALFEDEYEVKEELGKGKFGNVHRCIEKNSNLSWAAKIIKCREKEKPGIHQEIQVMNSMRHPKLLMLWDAFESPKTMVLVMEYIAGGELFERIIDDEFVLTERDCVHFMRQICDGVCYMHDHNILHLDLKPENILCISPSSNQIKIIDFGLARPYHPGESTKVMLGTPEFIAPEVINYDEIGFTTDMWSLGVVCYVLLSGLSPFLGDSDPETLVNVTLGEFDFDDDAFNDISNDAKDFIERLVVKNKEKRLTVHQCLKHRWLAQDVKRLRLKRLNTRNLKQFMARRKWQKMGNAIRALGRMAALQRAMHSSRSSSPVPNESKYDESTTNNNSNDDNDLHVSSALTSKSTALHSSSIKVNQMQENFRKLREDHADDSDSEIETKRRTLTSAHSKDSGIDTYKDKDSYSSMTDLSAGGGALEFLQQMEDVEVVSGDVVLFKVCVTGRPEPTITWFKGRSEITPSRRCIMDSTDGGEHTLKIKDVTLEDAGEYRCSAVNATSQVMCAANMTVVSI